MSRRNASRLVVSFILILLVIVGVALNNSRNGYKALISQPEFERCPIAYKMYALSYGSGIYSEKYMIEGGDIQKVPIEFLFFIVVGGQKKILIDTGSEDQDMLKNFGVADPRSPMSLLNTLGIQPEEITDIILTHAHWDHAGTLSQFPQARIWLQKTEFEHIITRRLNEERRFMNGYKYDDLQVLEKLKQENRINLVSGNHEILPCITTFLAQNTHTPGSQFVTVKTVTGTFVFSGDNAYLYENIEQNIPIGDTLSKMNNLRTIKDMIDIASSKNMIIPSHEPKIFNRSNCSLQHIACLN
jgi:glyoxylase-like metal-dependent hydrolase (beta-lactamase superfamily II)